MPILNITQGVHAGEKRIIHGSRTVIGRSEDCGVILRDDDVDPAHASIEARGNRWVLQDLGAPGGTWVNEEEIVTPRRIVNGDVIRLNQVVMVFDEDKEPSAPASALSDSAETPAARSAKKNSRKSTWRTALEIGLALVVILFGATFMLGNDRTVVEYIRTKNEPPVLRSLIDNKDISIMPGEQVFFHVEAADSKDLGRVEYWINDHLEEVKQPPADNVTKMQMLQIFSSDEPGLYQLKIVAYDEAGQTSKAVYWNVLVKNPS
jgi:pSer/pThr/pTyr-binding forkhead associated (FHA) protein